MAEHHTTCALLGVSVAAACRDALASSGKRIVVALDGDAFYQSTKISEQLQRAGCDVQVVKLDRDIKNLDSWEVSCLSKK
jgi:deoxyxylulose-5-phosphate synthase